MAGAHNVQFLFGDHVLDDDRRELSRGAAPIAVEPQVFDLLIYLVQNRDRVVSKNDLIDSVWGGRVVSDSTLTSRINAARKAIGDSGQKQMLIRTIARKGLRFVGDVRIESNGQSPRVASPGRRPMPRDLALRIAAAGPSGDCCASLRQHERRTWQDYFSDGISEDIITALSKLGWFFVIARNSSFTYKGKSVHMSKSPKNSALAMWLKAACAKAATACASLRSSTTSSLPAATSGLNADRDIADVFAVQDEITEAIVAAIEPQLYAAEISARNARHPIAWTRGIW